MQCIVRLVSTFKFVLGEKFFAAMPIVTACRGKFSHEVVINLLSPSSHLTHRLVLMVQVLYLTQHVECKMSDVGDTLARCLASACWQSRYCNVRVSYCVRLFVRDNFECIT